VSNEFAVLLNKCLDLPLLSLAQCYYLEDHEKHSVIFFIVTHVFLWLSQYGVFSLKRLNSNPRLKRLANYLLNELHFFSDKNYVEYSGEAIWCLEICDLFTDQLQPYKDLIKTWQNSDGSWTTYKSIKVDTVYEKIHPTLCALDALIPQSSSNRKSSGKWLDYCEKIV
jgi:hypothetical protein